MATNICDQEKKQDVFQVFWDQVHEIFWSTIRVANKRKVHKTKKKMLQEQFDKDLKSGQMMEEALASVAKYVESFCKVSIELSFNDGLPIIDVHCNKTDIDKTISNNTMKDNEKEGGKRNGLHIDSADDCDGENLYEEPRKKFRWPGRREESSEAGEKIERQQKRIRSLEYVNQKQQDQLDILKEKNASLSLRNADFTKLKITQQLGERRSSLMFDISLFSNAFHKGDQLMQEQDPVHIDTSVFLDLKRYTVGSGNFCIVEKASLPDGESVVLKTLKGSFGMQAMAVTSHEHRLLTFLGTHENIVQTFGIMSSNNTLTHILRYEPGFTLEAAITQKISIHLVELRENINGLVDGINHLFSKGVLHNHLTPSNIILQGYTPKITGFTFACRESCSKTKVEHVLKKFADQSHFAPELFKGARVTYSSDIYSCGIILKKIMKRSFLFNMPEELKTPLECIIDHCLKLSPGKRLPHIFLQGRVNAILKAS